MKPVLLIAESNDTLSAAYRQWGLRHGYEVDTAAGGLECLSKLRRSCYRLLVLDLNLPWGGGEGVLAVMRDDPRLAQVPVIVTTTAVARADLISPPVVRALEKPFALTALLEGVRSVLAEEREPARNAGPGVASARLRP